MFKKIVKKYKIEYKKRTSPLFETETSKNLVQVYKNKIHIYNMLIVYLNYKNFDGEVKESDETEELIEVKDLRNNISEEKQWVDILRKIMRKNYIDIPAKESFGMSSKTIEKTFPYGWKQYLRNANFGQTNLEFMNYAINKANTEGFPEFVNLFKEISSEKPEIKTFSLNVDMREMCYSKNFMTVQELLRQKSLSR